MRQLTLASQAIFEKHSRKSKREVFLDQMEQVVPWTELLALVEPHYPKEGNGRKPVGLTIMLRTYFLQLWFNLSDPGMEEAFYDSSALRRFAGVDLGVAAAPDETTILRFRHLLVKHEQSGQMIDTVNLYRERKGRRSALQGTRRRSPWTKCSLDIREKRFEVPLRRCEHRTVATLNIPLRWPSAWRERSDSPMHCGGTCMIGFQKTPL